MKKLLTIAVAVLCAAFTAAAQDMAEATQTAQAANEALTSGDNATALNQFKAALEMAELCGGEGMELVETCKGIIPKILMSMSKGEIKAGNFDGGLAKLKETISAATEYGDNDLAEEAKEMVSQVINQKAASLLNNKDFAGAVEAYKGILESNPTDGMAALRLGMAQDKLGNAEAAIEAYKTAMENGQDKNARKQLSTIFLKQAQAALKGGKFKEALAAAEQSSEYLESANAFKLAASAATKLGDKDKSIDLYEKYLGIAPNASDANGIICTLAVLYQQMGNKDKAVEYYEKILTDPKFGATAKAQLAALKK